MKKTNLPVTAMFEELVKLGYLTPPVVMEEMQFPGQLLSVPSLTTYGIPDVPLRTGVYENAKLGQRAQADYKTEFVGGYQAK